MKCTLRTSASSLLKKAKAKIYDRLNIKSHIGSFNHTCNLIQVSTFEICVFPAMPVQHLENIYPSALGARPLPSNPTQEVEPIHISTPSSSALPTKRTVQKKKILHRNPLRLNPVGSLTWQEEDVNEEAHSDQGEQSDQDYYSFQDYYSVQESHSVLQTRHIQQSHRGQEEHSDQDYHSVQETHRGDEWHHGGERLPQEECWHKDECRREEEALREEGALREEENYHGQESRHDTEVHMGQEDDNDIPLLARFIPFHQRSMEETQRYDRTTSGWRLTHLNSHAERIHRSPLHLDSTNTTIWDGGFSHTTTLLAFRGGSPARSFGKSNTAPPAASEIASISKAYEVRVDLQPKPTCLSSILEDDATEEMHQSPSGTTLQNADADGSSGKGVEPTPPPQLGRKTPSRDLRGTAAGKLAPTISLPGHQSRAELSSVIPDGW